MSKTLQRTGAITRLLIFKGTKLSARVFQRSIFPLVSSNQKVELPLALDETCRNPGPFSVAAWLFSWVCQARDRAMVSNLPNSALDRSASRIPLKLSSSEDNSLDRFQWLSLTNGSGNCSTTSHRRIHFSVYKLPDLVHETIIDREPLLLSVNITAEGCMIRFILCLIWIHE